MHSDYGDDIMDAIKFLDPYWDNEQEGEGRTMLVTVRMRT